MKINYISDETASSSGVIANEMTIDSKRKAKLIAILSSNLYRDRITSVIREISSNAHDAHIMGACLERSFLMTIPTWEKPSFEVRDYGIGLTPAKAAETIFSYLGSDKDNSDDFIGGWGLGSKSPFAYTNAFEVTLYKDGLFYQYNCWLDKSGIPHNAIFENGITEEPNGVLVRVPVKATDVHRFKGACVKYLEETSFNVEVANADDYVIHKKKTLHTFSCDGYDFRVTDHASDGGLKVLYGGFIYPIDDLTASFEEEGNKRLAALANIFSGYAVLVDTKVGVCEFQPSRESLSGSQRTMEYVNGAMEAVISHLNDQRRKYVEEFIKSLSAYAEKCAEEKEPIDLKYVIDFINKSQDITFRFANYVTFRNSSVFDKLIGDNNNGRAIIDEIKIPMSLPKHIYANGKAFNPNRHMRRLSEREGKRRTVYTVSKLDSTPSLELDLMVPLGHQYEFMWHNFEFHKVKLTEYKGTLPYYIRRLSVEASSVEEAKVLYEKMGIKGVSLTLVSDVYTVVDRDRKKQRSRETAELPKVIQDSISLDRTVYSESEVYVGISEDSCLYKHRHGNYRIGSKYIKFFVPSPFFVKKYGGWLENFITEKEFRKRFKKDVDGKIGEYKKYREALDLVKIQGMGVNLTWLGIVTYAQMDEILEFHEKVQKWSYNKRSYYDYGFESAVRLFHPNFDRGSGRVNVDLIKGTVNHLRENTALKFFNWGQINEENKQTAKSIALQLIEMEVPA